MSESTAGAATIAGIVERQRLYDVLDSALVRVWVVQGPSGSGKTTLLRSWAAQNGDDRVVWISLNDSVASRQMFWQHVASTAARLGDLTAEDTARVRRQLGAAVDPVRIAAGILLGAGPTVLVLDAYEHLGDVSSAIDEDLSRLLRTVPDVKIMITTRSATALLDHDPAVGPVRVVTLADLALNEAEVGELIELSAGIGGDRLARPVVAATGGFPLTVRAMALAIAQLGAIPSPGSAEWTTIVAARLESMLPDAATVRFVTDTCVPPYVDAELAGVLSEEPDAVAVLDGLERAGFGRWIPYSPLRPVFQYVEAIRAAFRVRAGADPERFRRAQHLTARWLFANDEIDQALIVAIEGADYDFADRVFVDLLIHHPDSYVTDRFLRTLQGVPDGILPEYPMLAFGLGLAMMANPVLRHGASRCFDVAARSTAHRSYLHPAIDELSLASMRAIALRLEGKHVEAAAAARRVLARIDALDADPTTVHGEHLGTVLRQLGYTVFLAGDASEALTAIDRSAAFCRTQTARNYSLACAVGISAFAGDNARALRLEALIDPDAWPDEFRSSSLNGLRLIADGHRHLDALEFESAVGALAGTRPYIQTNEYWPLITAVLVSARTGLGHGHAEAERVLRELTQGGRPPGVGDNGPTEDLIGTIAFALLTSGEIGRAGEALRPVRADSPFVAAARVAHDLARDHDRAALEHAIALAALPDHTLRTRAHLRTVGAVAALRGGDEALAARWLNDAAVVWESYGPRRHVALLPVRHRRLLSEFAQERSATTVNAYLDIAVSRIPSDEVSAVALSPRESVVLDSLAVHASIRGIAEDLVVSPHTVKTQLQSIYRKLGVSSRKSALAVAAELGLVDPARSTD